MSRGRAERLLNLLLGDRKQVRVEETLGVTGVTVENLVPASPGRVGDNR